MADTDVLIKIGLEVESLKKQLTDLQKDMKDAGEKAGSTISDGVSKSLRSGILKVGAALGGIAFFKTIVKESAEAEVNLNRMNLALRNAGTAADGAGFEKFAEEIQKTTTTTKDTAVELLTLATNMGFTGQKAKDLTTAAMNLSAATGVDLNTALKQLGGTVQGEAGRLGKIVPGLNDLTQAALKSGGAIDLVNKRLAGAAANETRTFSGALAQASNSLKEVFQSMGGFITKSPAMIGLLNGLSKVFLTLSETISQISNEGFKEFILVMVRFTQVIGILAGAIIDVGVGAFKALGAAIGGVAAALVNLASGNFSGAKEALVASFEDIKTAVSDAANFDAASAALRFGETLVQFTEQAKPFAAASGAAIGGALSDSMSTTALSGLPFIEQGFNEAFGRVALTSEKFRETLQKKVTLAFTAFRDGVSTSFSAIGSALVKGENAFAAFGKVVLGLFGDLAIQLGSFYFLLGLGNLFINPGAAAGQIAAGIGLSILGGALKAIAGGGGGDPVTPTGASQSAGFASSGGLGTTDTPAELERSPTTAVTVNVQGNILDRRESGLAIAEIINETFGSNGVVLAQAT